MSSWRRAQKWGEKIRIHETVQATVASGLPQRGQVVRGMVPGDQRMGVAMDGAMINIRAEGWKELSGGCV